MASRVGIELAPTACRVVEATPLADGETRVGAFASLPLVGPATHARLSALRRRRAAVVVWGVPSEYRLIAVSAGRTAAMRADAIARFERLPRRGRADIDRLLIDVAPAPRRPDSPDHAMMLIAAEAAAVKAAVQPLTAVGVRVGSVVTPALALLSLARARTVAATGAVEAYVALEGTATCAALVRDGALLAVRDMAWGYLEETRGRRELRPRLDTAARLGDELTALFAAVRDPVSQICVCGGLHDLRSTTMPLMERLDVEVEPLDSMFGIDTAHLPEPVDEFRDRVSELRLASAIAADDRAPLNLLRQAHRRAARRLMVRAAAIAGVAAGMGALYEAPRTRWWHARTLAQPAPKLVARATPAPVLGKPAPPAALLPVKIPATMLLSQPETMMRPAPVLAKPAPRPANPPRPHPEPPVLPFDAVLGTILYAPDRQAAIVDGKIVQPGDEIRGARVIDITSTSVLFRDAQGRRRELTLPGAK